MKAQLNKQNVRRWKLTSSNSSHCRLQRSLVVKKSEQWEHPNSREALYCGNSSGCPLWFLALSYEQVGCPGIFLLRLDPMESHGKESII